MQKKIRKIIRKELDVFFESFNMNNDSNSYVPPEDVAKTAKTALQALSQIKNNGGSVKSLDGNGNEGSGKLKAKGLSIKTPQSFSEMKRLKAFFESNKTDVTKTREKFGLLSKKSSLEEMLKFNILLVWNLHGGDDAMNWVNSQLSDTHEQGNKKKSRLRNVGGAGKNKGMGVFNFKYDPSQKRIHR